MSDLYERLGRLVLWALYARYRTQIRIAAGAAIGAVLIGGYLAATRDPPEG